MISEYEKHITNLQEMWEDNVGSLTPAMVADYMQEQGMLNSKPLTDEEMETLITRITPSLYDVVLDGVDESKTDLFRKLRIIINDIITTRQKGNSMKTAEGNKSYAQQLVDEYFDSYKTKKPSESDLPMILSLVEFMLKKFYYVTDGSEQTTTEPIPPKTQNLYVYVTELLKEDAEPYRDGKREAMHEIPISYGLPIELIYGFVVCELERIYTFERSPEITGFEITKIIFALDMVEPLTLTVTLSEFHKSPELKEKL